MRCSSCKPSLDRYAEGTLSTRELLRISHHLARCIECSALLEELRAVDGLLATIRTAAPAANFTFAVMAEVRSMPVPAPHRMNLSALFGAYIVVAWAIIALWLGAAGITAQAAFERTAAAAAVFFGTGHALANGALSSFGSGAPLVTTFAFAVLSLDCVVALGVLVVYAVIRPRLTARLASSPEVS